MSRGSDLQPALDYTVALLIVELAIEYRPDSQAQS